MKITFTAPEYTADDRFIQSKYDYSGSTESGWMIHRNGAPHLELGPGYRLLRTHFCGICSTDLARRFLPFPLPQVIGHEVVATDPDSGEEFIVEINDTCAARGDTSPEPFCAAGLPSHCPGRMVLGIDRLPGGFGPWMLVPIHAALPIGGLPARAAVLAEPFAAALHAVTTSTPGDGDRVAVLGPGRLGLLIVSALSLWRKRSGTDFIITLLGRHDRNFELGLLLGADETILIEKILHGVYDIVFDASGSPEGFETSLALSRREVHLKSTHGRECCGLRHLTELVVDELALLPFNEENLEFKWERESRRNEWIFRTPGSDAVLPDSYRSFRGDSPSALRFMKSDTAPDTLGRFDLAVASSIEEIDACIRPESGREESLVRPRGAVLYGGDGSGNPLLSFLESGRSVRSSRCGDFRAALQLIAGEKDFPGTLEKNIITHEFPASRLSAAFEAAKSGVAVKVIIRHD